MKCRLGRRIVVDAETSQKNLMEVPLLYKIETADEVLDRVVQRILSMIPSKIGDRQKSHPHTPCAI